MRQKTLRYVLLPGDGIGPEMARHFLRLMDIFTMRHDPIVIDNIRLENNELDPVVVEKIKEVGIALKGPTETPTGNGARSLNVALRQQLGLHANVRPIRYLQGVKSPLNNPEAIDMTVFRQNTEDVYGGIEFEAGSEKALQLWTFLIETLGVDPELIPHGHTTGFGIKTASEQASKALMRLAIQHAIENEISVITIAHKGNIMKYTEGAFMKWCIEVANDEFAGKVQVRLPGQNIEYTGDDTIVINTIICDDSFQQILLRPENFNSIVCTNLNGDYLSDAIAGAAGGVALAFGINTGDNCVLYEAVGGTAKNIADKDIVNPIGFFLAGVAMLDDNGFTDEAAMLEKATQSLLSQGIGTADLGLNEVIGTTEFTDMIIEILEKNAVAVE